MAGTQRPQGSPPLPQAGAATLTHHSSRRVTAGISFHSFYSAPLAAPSSGPPAAPPGSPDTSLPGPPRWLRPTQDVTLQFPEDLDPVGGRHGLSFDDRRCTFTPCSLRRPAALPSGNSAGHDKDTLWVSILTRNGRITGLLGLPRPYQALVAQVVDVGGGFAAEVLDAVSAAPSPRGRGERAQTARCVAGGTGIAPFTTLDAHISSQCCLLWSIRSDDFGAVEFALREGLLLPSQWSDVAIFVTSGGDAGGVAAEQPPAWWQQKFATLVAHHPGHLRLEKRRMTADDLAVAGSETTSRPGVDSEPGRILFCGSKSLEWQVRMWSMGTAQVHVTEMT